MHVFDPPIGGYEGSALVLPRFIRLGLAGEMENDRPGASHFTV